MDSAVAGVEAALAAGARYADARVMHRRSESMAAQNGEIEGLRQSERSGVGVRALVGSSWGFFATSVLGVAAARRAGEVAARTGAASARVPGPDLELAPVDAVIAHWESRCDEDPLSVSLADKGDLLVGVTRTGLEAGAR
ncbi:MAG: PmbA/TldA family metallopeptidase, partial [Acidimicrobiales bacterium]